jgi:hypothetical protein
MVALDVHSPSLDPPLGDFVVTDLATACLHFKTAKIATLLKPDDMSLREPLKHTRWRLQQLSIVDYLRMVEQAHAEASALRGIIDPCSPPRHEHCDAVAEDPAQQQHDDEAKPGIDAIAVDQSATEAPAVVPEGVSTQRKKTNSVPDRRHSARRAKPRRGQ